MLRGKRHGGSGGGDQGREGDSGGTGVDRQAYFWPVLVGTLVPGRDNGNGPGNSPPKVPLAVSWGI